MTSQGGVSNVDKLREARVIVGPLPAEYVAVFEGLSDDEVAAILKVKNSLDGAAQGAPAAEHWAMFVPF
jgi:hypothetical protein